MSDHRRWAARTTLACVAIALCGSASAHMAPEVYERARDEAPGAVVVRVAEVEVPSPTPGDCLVRGTIEGVERDETGRLRAGDTIAFAVSCAGAGDEVPSGGVIWKSVSLLERTSLLRAWLEPGGDEGWRVVSSQTQILATTPVPPSRFPWTLVVLLGAAIAFAVGSIVWSRSRRA